MNIDESTVQPTPVLMIPLRRCGSHAIRLRLNFSHEFYSPYPLHIVDFMPLVPLYGDLRDDDTYFQLIVDVIGLQTASMVKWDTVFSPVRIFDALKDRPRSIHAITWELLFEAGRRAGAKVVMDKSLDSIAYADELLRLFPTMKFLNVVRDPRAQVNSMNRAIIHDFDSLLNAATWQKAHVAARTLAATHPDSVLTIRYEDFLENQESVLKKISAFFGIGFMPEMLEISQSSEARDISTMSALWETNFKAPVRDNIDKYKKLLTTDEIRTIESVCHDLMDVYGYARITEGKVKPTPDLLEQARRHSIEQRQLAWEKLKETNPKDYILRRARTEHIGMVHARLVPRRDTPASIWNRKSNTEPAHAPKNPRPRHPRPE